MNQPFNGFIRHFEVTISMLCASIYVWRIFGEMRDQVDNLAEFSDFDGITGRVDWE